MAGKVHPGYTRIERSVKFVRPCQGELLRVKSQWKCWDCSHIQRQTDKYFANGKLVLIL